MLKLIRGRAATPAAGVPAAAPRPVDELSALAAQGRAGDARAIRTLLVATGPAMLQVIRRVLGSGNPEVEDAFQEATFGLIEALRGFRGECTVLHFACRVAVLTAMATRRRHEVRQRYASEAPVDEQIGVGDGQVRNAESAAMAGRRRELLRRLVEELPVPQAEALLLHCVVGFTLDEVAGAAGIPLETARSRLRLAKCALRARIEEEGLAPELSEEGA
jgi:RNA polymerase sigma factor (sigma-70 family)